MKQRPKPLSEEEQKQKMMEQIRSMNEKVVVSMPVQAAAIEAVLEEIGPVEIKYKEELKEAILDAVFTPLDAPATPPADSPPTSLRHYDVVQVFDNQSNHYGVIFQVGDVRGQKVHGYYLQPRGEKVYVTFDMPQLRLIGTARVRSKAACSAKWVEQHSTQQQ